MPQADHTTSGDLRELALRSIKNRKQRESENMYNITSVLYQLFATLKNDKYLSIFGFK